MFRACGTEAGALHGKNELEFSYRLQFLEAKI